MSSTKREISPEEKRLRKAARTIKGLCELEDQPLNATDTEVMQILASMDLESATTTQMRERVVSEIGNRPAAVIKPAGSDRREAILGFLKENWETVKKSDAVRKMFFNDYCRGRYTKTQRRQILSDLLVELGEDPTAFLPSEESEDQSVDF